MISFFFVGVCDVLQLVVVIRTAVLFSVATAVYYSTMVFVCTTPRRGGLRFGKARLFRAEQAVPRGRPRRFKAVKRGGGHQNKYSSWRPPPVAKQTKPIDSDSLQVQEKPVVSTPP